MDGGHGRSLARFEARSKEVLGVWTGTEEGADAGDDDVDCWSTVPAAASAIESHSMSVCRRPA